MVVELNQGSGFEVNLNHSFSRLGPNFPVFFFFVGDLLNENLSASITNQPVHREENLTGELPQSNSDQFLTTPDDTEDKDLPQDGSELKHRAPKKDLLEIDRFTICGNRID